MRNARGATLVELLIVAIISSIAMLALVAPFVAERRVSIGGRRQTEAQRDAQIGLRAMARAARESSSYIRPAANNVTFTDTTGGAPCTRQFQQVVTAGNSQLVLTDGCAGTVVTLIGGRSQVSIFNVDVVNTRLVRVQLGVTHETQGSETVQTELYLRNAP